MNAHTAYATTTRAPWSHLGALLVVAVDGTTISTRDSPENAAAFGKPGTGAK